MLKQDSKDLSPKRLSFKKNFLKLRFRNLLKSTQNSFFKSIREFCKNSTLPGLSYLANKELCWRERTFFAISFVFVAIIAAIFIQNVYNKWCTTPVIFSINPQTTHIKNEPFPALTICNMNQAYKTSAMKLDQNSTAFIATQMLCRQDVDAALVENIKDWSFLNNFITNISQPCERLLLACRYGGITYNCSHLFRPIITDEGLCCTFNMVHPKHMYRNVFLKDKTAINKNQLATDVPWSPEEGYPLNLPKHFYPYKAAGIGMSLGLHITLNAEIDEYYCPSSNNVGLRMVVHNPTEEPCVREIGLTITPGFYTKVRVRIKKLHSDPTLKRIAVKHRQCLFQDEDDLHYFTRYSQRNCIRECLAGLNIRLCGCVPHFEPKRYGNETICSLYNDCMPRLDMYQVNNNRHCDEMCLPSCSEFNYHTDVFNTPFSSMGFETSCKKLNNFSRQYVNQNIAKLIVYYTEPSYRSNVQTEFIGMTDVLSGVGGLIGLFFGFSLISLAEIIFYTLVRPCREALTQKNNGKSKNLSVASPKPIKTLKYSHQRKRNPFKNSALFRVSPKMSTISQAYNPDNMHQQYYIQNLDLLQYYSKNKN